VHLTVFLAGFYPAILAGFYAADYTLVVILALNLTNRCSIWFLVGVSEQSRVNFSGFEAILDAI